MILQSFEGVLDSAITRVLGDKFISLKPFYLYLLFPNVLPLEQTKVKNIKLSLARQLSVTHFHPLPSMKTNGMGGETIKKDHV